MATDKGDQVSNSTLKSSSFASMFNHDTAQANIDTGVASNSSSCPSPAGNRKEGKSQSSVSNADNCFKSPGLAMFKRSTSNNVETNAPSDPAPDRSQPPEARAGAAPAGSSSAIGNGKSPGLVMANRNMDPSTNDSCFGSCSTKITKKRVSFVATSGKSQELGIALPSDPTSTNPIDSIKTVKSTVVNPATLTTQSSGMKNVCDSSKADANIRRHPSGLPQLTVVDKSKFPLMDVSKPQEPTGSALTPPKQGADPKTNARPSLSVTPKTPRAMVVNGSSDREGSPKPCPVNQKFDPEAGLPIVTPATTTKRFEFEALGKRVDEAMSSESRLDHEQDVHQIGGPIFERDQPPQLGAKTANQHLNSEAVPNEGNSASGAADAHMAGSKGGISSEGRTFEKNFEGFLGNVRDCNDYHERYTEELQNMNVLLQSTHAHMLQLESSIIDANDETDAVSLQFGQLIQRLIEK